MNKCTCTCNSCLRGNHRGPGQLDMQYEEHQRNCKIR